MTEHNFILLLVVSKAEHWLRVVYFYELHFFAKDESFFFSHPNRDFIRYHKHLFSKMKHNFLFSALNYTDCLIYLSNWSIFFKTRSKMC